MGNVNLFPSYEQGGVTGQPYVDPTLAGYFTRKPQTSPFASAGVNQPTGVGAWPAPGTGQTSGSPSPHSTGPVNAFTPGTAGSPTDPANGQTGQPGAPTYNYQTGTDSSFDAYASDPIVQTIKTGLGQGKAGPDLPAWVQSQYPGAKVTWDPVRGNVDLDLGGGTGLQFDKNAAGVWGVHTYSDGAGAPGGGSAGSGQAVDLTGAINGLNLSGTKAAGEEQSFLDLLLGRANESLKVDPRDSIVKAQTDAFAASGERQLRNYLSSAAEKGGPNQNVEAITRSANEGLAQADATFTGQVLQSELTARRAEVAQALQLYGSSLSGDLTRSLQEELAKLDAAIAEAQLQQGAYQFDATRADRLAGF